MTNSPEMLAVIPKDHDPIDDLNDEDVYRIGVAALLGLDPLDEKIDRICGINMRVGGAAAEIVTLVGASAWGNFGRTILGSVSPELAQINDVVTNRKMVTALTRGLLSSGHMKHSDVEIITLGDDRIAKLTSKHGRFQLNTVYRVHPARNTFYLPFSGFHDFLLEEKKAEFVRIASSLGAKSIHLMESDRRSKSGEARAGVDTPFGEDTVDIGAQAGFSANMVANFEINWEASEPPQSPPSLPGQLYWYHQEPFWQTMAATRLDNWATKYNVRFRYATDFNVNARVAAQLKAVGLSLGGNFKSMKEIEQEYVVEFWPRSVYGGQRV